ncbi:MULTISPECIES: hypothetical protein [Methylobacterium]|uniref:Uncharacterized protein n=1 Tax=Methylobacterium jeotgali TaxID=381630 RepID=A0ABQ4STR8_9HYPH|nr:MULTISPECIES: hypothetical protein [Methylobacterium]PIU06195.1 MAG: hypothetical protein COT56_10185 [Methylobacterium sp. CG09_land_8_20_14_0_10_71_15]PIU14486.1 MAG: hypothetical protein COT28_07450 [Methylobacterium sp. CG08_land_8_20_14_0_20_71_15]GBU18248.1 hypothetical protein AwMethylo_24630 [Methylobacterium sp.]GJE05169.1 hypothetical protein AOPFMNJM_0466 [Methylobacterium jeotgali]
MPLRTLSALALASLPLVAAAPALAGPAQSYQYEERQMRSACRPPLKFAAGACVRRCPPGYQDQGRTCRFRSMRW